MARVGRAFKEILWSPFGLCEGPLFSVLQLVIRAIKFSSNHECHSRDNGHVGSTWLLSCACYNRVNA